MHTRSLAFASAFHLQELLIEIKRKIEQNNIHLKIIVDNKRWSKEFKVGDFVMVREAACSKHRTF
ncbi:hypothetical protein KFK09_011576 [Dendrobium nobile]|uniref:Uncharacterized protein n=1 Tax=Dendrobium nobile TaxID=94219 RepID=A0A8T3BFA6_DENNO|nr:hypothetical protein KFK09_011576 [Dendrobium nobile]